MVPRTGVNIKDIYANVRHWTRNDWRAHPDLVRDLVKSGHAEIIKSDTAENEPEEPAERLSHRLPSHQAAKALPSCIARQRNARPTITRHAPRTVSTISNPRRFRNKVQRHPADRLRRTTASVRSIALEV